jgi:hypothetical protein
MGEGTFRAHHQVWNMERSFSDRHGRGRRAGEIGYQNPLHRSFRLGLQTSRKALPRQVGLGLLDLGCVLTTAYGASLVDDPRSTILAGCVCLQHCFCLSMWPCLHQC